MSSFRKRETTMNHQPTLVSALGQIMGCDVESHEQAQVLHNHWGAGHGVNYAEVIVRSHTMKGVHHSTSDIGFKKSTGGNFELVVNDMDNGQFNDKWLGKVTTRYGIERLKSQARREGWTVQKNEEVSVRSNGEYRTITMEVD